MDYVKGKKLGVYSVVEAQSADRIKHFCYLHTAGKSCPNTIFLDLCDTGVLSVWQWILRKHTESEIISSDLSIKIRYSQIGSYATFTSRSLKKGSEKGEMDDSSERGFQWWKSEKKKLN